MSIIQSIPRTEELLEQNGLEIEKHDGSVYLIGGDRIDQVNELITLKIGEFINTLRLYDDAVLFNYNTAKSYYFSFPRKMQKLSNNTKTFEEWFLTYEEIAMTFAEEVGVNAILVQSGRNDRAFLESIGYEKQSKYYYRKNFEV